MNISEQILLLLHDPNVAYLLFIIGILGLAAEIYHPGTLIPGTIGAIALVLAIISFASLSVNWFGLALVLLAVVLFLVDAHSAGIGLLAAGGVVVFVLGSLLLFSPGISPSTAASLRVSPWLIGLMTLGISSFFLFLVRATLRTRHLPVTTGQEALLGREGVAVTDLAPRGTVRVAGELWSAVAEGSSITAGESVEIIGVEGVTLRVRRPYETLVWGA